MKRSPAWVLAMAIGVGCGAADSADVADAGGAAEDAGAPSSSSGSGTAADGGASSGGSSSGSSDAGTARALVDAATFDSLFLHRASTPCRGAFYTHAAFLEAASSYPAFGAVGSDATRRREIAAFLAQVAHETTGGWPTAPDGAHAWGLCWITEGATAEPSALPDYCQQSADWPCAAGKKYFGRGPMQLSWNYNYGPCGAALGLDLLADPDRVSNDPVVAFRAALWFWMTPQAPKPSAHDVMIGAFQPSAQDAAAGRGSGFGLTTNIVNGGLECGHGADDRVTDRIGFFQRFTEILGTDAGPNLDCGAMSPYGG